MCVYYIRVSKPNSHCYLAQKEAVKCMYVLMVVLLATWLCSCPATSVTVYTVAYNTLLCLTVGSIPNVHSVLLNTKE